MFKRIIFILCSFLSVTAFAQKSGTKVEKLKVKIKKDQLLINDSIVGNWETAGNLMKGHQYHFKSLDNKPILSFEDSGASSLLEDSSYTFIKIIFHDLKRVANVYDWDLAADNNIESKVARTMVNTYRLLTASGKIDTAGYEEFIKKNPDTLVTNEVRQSLNYQKWMMTNFGYIATRDVSKVIEVKSIGGCSKVPNWHIVRCYDIVQDNVKIGRVRVIGQDSNNALKKDTWERSMRVEFYNAKDASIALYRNYQDPEFVAYQPKVKYDRYTKGVGNPFKQFQGSETNLIFEISKWLTDNKNW